MHDIFYFTDVHGNYPLFRAAMDFCMKEDPDCTIIYGGDACDRGTSGYKIMKELLDNHQVVYMKGNHEDMFVHAAWFIKDDYKGVITEDRIYTYLDSCETYDFHAQPVQLCLYNGGFHTLKDWMLDGMPMDFVARLNRLPITFSYENLDFCHAGGTYKTFQRVSVDEYNDNLPDNDDQEELIWDRIHLGQGWKSNRICVFGHTPTPFLPAKYYSMDKSLANAHPACYTGLLDDRWTGKKIDMDVGTVGSGRVYVLNCLTLKAFGFKDIDFENREVQEHNIKQFEVIQF